MNNLTKIDRFLAYRHSYEARLNRILRHRGRDFNLTYCLGIWVNSNLSSKLQEVINEKRLVFFFLAHLLSLALILFSAAFLFAFSWYFFP